MEKKYNLPALALRSQFHELATIRAEIEELSQILLTDVAKRNGIEPASLVAEAKLHSDEKAKELFEHYCAAFGFDKDS